MSPMLHPGDINHNNDLVLFSEKIFNTSFFVFFYNRWNFNTFHNVKLLHQNFLPKSFQLLLLLSVHSFLSLLFLFFLIFFLCYFFLIFFFALTSAIRQAFLVAFSVYCIFTIFLK